MSSIKDKPLKKIICDKRITVDAIHTNKINKIQENLNIKSDIDSKISTLEIEINNEYRKNFYNIICLDQPYTLDSSINIIDNKKREDDIFTLINRSLGPFIAAELVSFFLRLT